MCFTYTLAFHLHVLSSSKSSAHFTTLPTFFVPFDPRFSSIQPMFFLLRFVKVIQPLYLPFFSNISPLLLYLLPSSSYFLYPLNYSIPFYSLLRTYLSSYPSTGLTLLQLYIPLPTSTTFYLLILLPPPYTLHPLQ